MLTTLRNPLDKIYLVGFMAAGKTTVAAALAARLGWRVLDIDQLIEERERMSVAHIFAARGEPYFRQAEREVLFDQVPIRQAIVATGGGTFVDPANQAIIKQDGISVWLDVPFQQLVERIPTDGRRPLAADRERLAQLFSARRIAYEQADVHLSCDHETVPALVERLLHDLAL